MPPGRSTSGLDGAGKAPGQQDLGRGTGMRPIDGTFDYHTSGEDNAPPRRRRLRPLRPEVESDGSVYELESADEDEDGNPLPSDPEQPNREYLSVARIKPDAGEDFVSLASIPSPSKRHADPVEVDSRPFKRVRKAFNHDYLNLLNVEIEDAAAHYVANEFSFLESSQIGLTIWSPAEKEILFESLSRLGRDGIPSISRRLQSKNEFEIQQYLKILEDAARVRKLDGKAAPLYPMDIPAAVELSPACCRVLEDAADTVSLRQEQHEEAIEESRWGDDWLITPSNLERIEASKPSGLLCLQLFRTSSWLRLSRRVFMNASFPENNWESISNESPAIRATALQDFYSLAVSITKRLVSATVYISESRIRSRAGLRRRAEKLVWPKDVEAAALSIGLKTDAKKFWAGCARRLRLDVYDDDYDSDVGDDTAEDIMPYDAVEAALGGVDDKQPAEPAEEDLDDLASSLSDTPSLDELSDLDPAADEDGPAQLSDAGDAEASDGLEAGDDGRDDDDDVHREAKEVLLYTAFEHPRTTRTRRAVQSRIRAELRHVAHADALDARAGAIEERRLWALLGREPSGEITVPAPQRAPPLNSRTVDDLIPGGPNWRERVQYAEEWEQPLGLPDKN